MCSADVQFYFPFNTLVPKKNFTFLRSLLFVTIGMDIRAQLKVYLGAFLLSCMYDQQWVFLCNSELANKSYVWTMMRVSSRNSESFLRKITPANPCCHSTHFSKICLLQTSFTMIYLIISIFPGGPINSMKPKFISSEGTGHMWTIAATENWRSPYLTYTTEFFA